MEAREADDASFALIYVIKRCNFHTMSNIRRDGRISADWIAFRRFFPRLLSLSLSSFHSFDEVFNFQGVNGADFGNCN